MNREQLKHAIRAATQIVKENSIIVIGSQSILGTWDEGQLPAVVTLSAEVDMMPLEDDDSEALARSLDIVGEWSEFHERYGFYIDGVGRSTATLPAHWEKRLVRVPVEKYDGGEALGLCLDPHDLCVAKVVAHRDKDRRFVEALIGAGLIDAEVLLERLHDTKRSDGANLHYAYSWVLDRLGPFAATSS